MTVSSITRKAGPYSGNGVTVAFPFAFKVFAAADVLVVLTDADGVEVEQVLNSDYTLALNADQNANPGGTITMLAAPAAGYRVTATSQVANMQPTDITNNGGFYPEVLEDAHDRSVIQVQQLAESVSRSMVMPLSSDLSSFQLTEGATASGRAERVIGFDASGNPTLHYASGATSLGIDLLTAVVSKGAALVAFIQAGASAVARTVLDKLRERVSVKDFGAVCDGTTDDTAAVQAAVNYCLTFTRPKTLVIPGRCKLTASVNIDRAVDTTVSDFRIVGEGDGAGFYVSTAITMFDSTIAMPGVDPVSEFVTFDGIHFEASNSALAAYVISKKFLRMQFLNNCHFENIKLADFGTAYAQTIRVSKANIRKWTGYFFNSAGSYDCDFEGNIAEFGESFFRSHDATLSKGSVGNRFRGNLFEGSTGAFVEASIVRGLQVVGNYLEGNTGRTLNLFVAAQVNYGVEFSGNSITSLAANEADAAFFEVQWGNTIGASSSGNYCTGRLHDQSTMVSDALNIDGDHAGLVLVKGGGTGITDAARAGGTGVWTGYDGPSKTMYVANAAAWAGIDGNFSAFVSTPAVNNGGVLVPMRLMFGTTSPQVDNTVYGSPYWAVGSRITNSAPAVGQPKGWLCTVSGQPGTWVSEGNL